MTGQCCTGERAPRRLARRRAGAAASILPGAALVLLPKCPLCVAAWLTAITGAGVSAAFVVRARALILAISVLVALAAAVWRGRTGHVQR